MKKDQTGHIYGRLTVLREATKEDFQKYHVHKQNRCIYWICQCACGNFTCVNGTSLRSGNTKSCGCLSRENLEKVDINLQILLDTDMADLPPYI